MPDDMAPDADVFALMPEWETAVEAEEAAARDLEHVQGEFRQRLDPVPSDLLVQSSDGILAWTHVKTEPCSHRGGEGQHWYGADDTLLALGRSLVRAKEVDVSGDAYIGTVIARIEGILGAGKRWHAHHLLMSSKLGLLAAEQTYIAAEERCSRLRLEIALTSPRTLEGLCSKARIAVRAYGIDAAGMSDVLRERVRREIPYGPSGPSLAEIVAFDLHRVAVEAGKGDELRSLEF